MPGKNYLVVRRETDIIAALCLLKHNLPFYSLRLNCFDFYGGQIRICGVLLQNSYSFSMAGFNNMAIASEVVFLEKVTAVINYGDKI